MKDKAVKILGSILIAVFVNFMFSNTVFLHTHQGPSGNTVTHSHPFCPASNHGHSSQSLDQIAGFNSAASTVEAAAVAVVAYLSTGFVVVETPSSERFRSVESTAYALRGPPFAG